MDSLAARRKIIISDIEDEQIHIKDTGGIPVEVQNSISKALDLKANLPISTTITLANNTIANTYTIILTAGHGVVANTYLAIVQSENFQLYYGRVLNVAGDIITLDNPISYPFNKLTAILLNYTIDMNVNGSITPVIFNITNYANKPARVTNITFRIEDNATMDDSLFGGIAALTNGIVIRKNNKDGTYVNYWNFKSNGSFTEVVSNCRYSARAPAGNYGYIARVTLTGQENHAVAIGLDPLQSIEVLVQDDLTALSSFKTVISGYILGD